MGDCLLWRLGKKSKITSTGGSEADFFSRLHTAYSAATERGMLTLPFGDRVIIRTAEVGRTQNKS